MWSSAYDFLVYKAPKFLVNEIVPAGGATAAAPDGGALASPSTLLTPHLLVVDASNLVNVQGLTR
jgi:hypothetical protein